MKRTLYYIFDVLLLGILALTASCSSDNGDISPEPTPDGPSVEPTTYTIMLYGSGDGVLDEYLKYSLSQVESYGKHSRVNFTGLVKFSSSYQADPNIAGTRLYTLTDEGLKNEKKYEASYRFDNPEHLTDFINETKEKMPADKYILVIRSCGQEFGYCDKPVQTSYPESESRSRAAVFDDNTNTILSVYELEKGIKDSGVKFDLLYFDLSMLSMAETYYQLKDCASYIMAASHSAPALSGNYSQLMSDLQENDSLVDAIKSYVPATVNNWANMQSGTADLGCFDTGYMDEFAQNMKTATSELLKLKHSQIDVPEGLDDFDQRQQNRVDWYGNQYYNTNERGNIYVYPNMNFSADLCSSLSRLADYYLYGGLSNAATLLWNTFNKMTVAYRGVGLPSWQERISIGINWPTKDFVNKLSDDYRINLSYSSFYQATGWDKFLLDSDTPPVFMIPSAYYGDWAHCYEGEKSPYEYAWTATASVDDSEITEADVDFVHSLVDELNAKYGEALAKITYPVRHSRGIDDDMNLVVTYEYKASLKYYGVKKVHIHVALKDGESINPNDTDAGKYPTTVDEDFYL